MKLIAASTALLSTCFILAAGCSLDSTTSDEEEAATQSESAVTIASTRLDLTRPNAPAALTTIKSLAQFRSFFGKTTPVPSAVDFSRGDWVLHYSAGPQPAGFEAALAVDLDTKRNALVVTEALSKPGSNCTVAQGKNTPQAAVRIARINGPKAPSVVSKKVNTTHDCAVVECPSNPDNAASAPDATSKPMVDSAVALFGTAANACSWYTGTLIIDSAVPRDTVHLKAGHWFSGTDASLFPESSEANCNAWKETVVVYRGGDATNGFANTRIAEKTRTGHWANGQCSDQDGHTVAQFAEFPVPRPSLNQDWYILAVESTVGNVTLPVELLATLDP